MNTKNTKQSSAVFIIHLVNESANRQIGESKNGRAEKSDKVICLAFSQKNKGQKRSDQ